MMRAGDLERRQVDALDAAQHNGHENTMSGSISSSRDRIVSSLARRYGINNDPDQEISNIITEIRDYLSTMQDCSVDFQSVMVTYPGPYNDVEDITTTLREAKEHALHSLNRRDDNYVRRVAVLFWKAETDEAIESNATVAERRGYFVLAMASKREKCNIGFMNNLAVRLLGTHPDIDHIVFDLNAEINKLVKGFVVEELLRLYPATETEDLQVVLESAGALHSLRLHAETMKRWVLDCIGENALGWVERNRIDYVMQNLDEVPLILAEGLGRPPAPSLAEQLEGLYECMVHAKNMRADANQEARPAPSPELQQRFRPRARIEMQDEAPDQQNDAGDIIRNIQDLEQELTFSLNRMELSRPESRNMRERLMLMQLRLMQSGQLNAQASALADYAWRTLSVSNTYVGHLGDAVCALESLVSLNLSRNDISQQQIDINNQRFTPDLDNYRREITIVSEQRNFIIETWRDANARADAERRAQHVRELNRAGAAFVPQHQQNQRQVAPLENHPINRQVPVARLAAVRNFTQAEARALLASASQYRVRNQTMFAIINSAPWTQPSAVSLESIIDNVNTQFNSIHLNDMLHILNGRADEMLRQSLPGEVPGSALYDDLRPMFLDYQKALILIPVVYMVLSLRAPGSTDANACARAEIDSPAALSAYHLAAVRRIGQVLAAHVDARQGVRPHI